MKYYKWMFDDRPSIVGVPGFAFTSYEDATTYGRDEFLSWFHGPMDKLGLYEFNGPSPLRVPFYLSSALMDQTIGPAQVSPDQVRATIDNLMQNGDDFLFTAQYGGPDAVALVKGIAYAAGAIVAARDVGDEAYCIRPTIMTRLSI